MVKEKTASELSPKEENSIGASTLDEIVKSFYESISFAIGRQPDYRRLRSLFHKQGIVAPPKNEKEKSVPVMDLDTFIKNSTENIVITGMERKGLLQTEIARRAQTFGNLAQIFTTFEAKHSSDEAAPVYRGIYSIQLIRENHRWWILSVLWENERMGLQVPRAYLI
jgi:hypothetical protein